MSGMRAWKAAAASGSSSSAPASMAKQIPLGECPSCCVPLIRIRSKQPESYNEIFVKCPYNIKEDPTTCRFIRSLEEYEMVMRTKKSNPEEEDLKHQVGEMKQDIGEMKAQIAIALGEIWRLKGNSEVKGKKALDSSVGVVIALVVGVVIGMLVTVMCK